MKVAILTQNEKVFIRGSLEYLIQNIPIGINLADIYYFEVSPFGKKLNGYQKLSQSYKIFGAIFVIKYLYRAFKATFLGAFDKSLTKKYGISVKKIQGSINSKENLNMFASKDYDLLISIGGNQIFEPNLIAIPKLGILNLHTALLPLYRGLMPTFWVLKNKEKKTGVSVFFVDEGIDTGPILVQRELLIETNSQFELIKSTKKMGMDAIVESLTKLEQNPIQKLIENNSEHGSYYGFPERIDVLEFLKKGNSF